MNNTTQPTAHSHPHIISAEGGIFSGKSVLNSPMALFLVQATIIISLSRLIHCFLHKARQPRVIAEIIGGICLGPSVLGQIPGFTATIFPHESLPMLSLVASFGLVMYMFLMGLELDTGILFRGIKRFTVISLAGILLPGVLGAFVSYGLYEFLMEPEKRDDTPFPSFLLFTLVALAITAFPVLARILTEKKMLSTPVGLMTISAAAIDDICAWVLLALVISIINAGDPFTAVYVLVTIGAYATLLLVPGRILLKKVFVKFFDGNYMLTQLMLATIFVMVFLSAWTTEWIGVHAIFGAFLIGIIIPRVGGIPMELTHKLEDLVSVALLPLYFASSGLKTKMALLGDATTALFCVLVIVVACAGKIIGCTLAARWTGFPWRESFSIGALMNTKGLVELIVLNLGLDAGVINDRIFAVMVVMALVTTFMTSPIISWIYPPKYHARPTPPIRPVSPMDQDVKRVVDGWSRDGDEHILLYLKDIDSIPLAANILHMYRSSLAKGRMMFLKGFKAFTDMESSLNIMVETQRELVIESDPTLKIFRFFGKLIGASTESLVATTRLADVGMEIERVVEESNLILVPWQQNALGGDQRSAVSSILNEVRNGTVGIFVDRRPAGTDSLFHDAAHPPFAGIIVLVTAGTANERSALQLAFRLRRQANKGVPLTVLHLQTEGEKQDSELVQTVRALSKKLDEEFLFSAVEADKWKGALAKELKKSSHFLVLLGHTNEIPLAVEEEEDAEGRGENAQEEDIGSPGARHRSPTITSVSSKKQSFFRRQMSSRASFVDRQGPHESNTHIFGTMGLNLLAMKSEGGTRPSLMVLHEQHEQSVSAA